MALAIFHNELALDFSRASDNAQCLVEQQEMFSEHPKELWKLTGDQSHIERSHKRLDFDVQQVDKCHLHLCKVKIYRRIISHIAGKQESGLVPVLCATKHGPKFIDVNGR